MEIQKLYLDSSHPNRPGTKLKKVTGVAIHWTANENSGADAVANQKYFNRKFKRINGEIYEVNGNPFRHASAHLIVDDNVLVESLPWKRNEAEMGYHVGGTKYMPEILQKLGTSYPNNSTIGLEICVNKDGNFERAYQNGIRVAAMMLKEHGLGIESLFRHYDVTGKLCPGFHTQSSYAKKYFGTSDYEKEWENFKAEVEYLLKGGVNMKPQVLKERIYTSGGKLHFVDLKGSNPYGVSATDVRFLKFNKDEIELKLVYKKGAKVSQLVKEHKADYGFNFPFFWDGQLLGDSEYKGEVFSGAYGKMLKWYEFAYVDGKPVIQKRNKAQKKDMVVQGAPPLVENGELVYSRYAEEQEVADGIKNGRSQRTVVGVDKEGNLLLCIADGRTKWDRGLSLEEAALYMQNKGADIALNGDGGGSTILADQSGGLNQDENIGVNERTVHHAVLVYIKEKKEEAPRYWRVFVGDKQFGAYSSQENAVNVARELYLKNKDKRTVVKDPSMNTIYTPAKHIDLKSKEKPEPKKEEKPPTEEGSDEEEKLNVGLINKVMTLLFEFLSGLIGRKKG